MRSRALLVAAAATLAVALAGCGGGGDQTFNTPTYPFSFSYPNGWTLTRGSKFNYGGDATALRLVTVSLKDPFDQATIAQYKLKKKLPAGENGYKPEVDRIVARLVKQAGGSASDAKVVKHGGLPGYQYVVKYPGGENITLENRVTFLFQGQNEFQISCQSSPDKREELNKGCDQILDSLEFK